MEQTTKQVIQAINKAIQSWEKEPQYKENTCVTCKQPMIGAHYHEGFGYGPLGCGCDTCQE